jgi:predicted hydrocarbon binding protein
MLNSFYDKFIYTAGLKYEHNNFKLVNLPFMIVPVELMVSILRKDDENTNKEIYYAIKESTKKHLLQQFELDFGLEGDSGLNFIESFFSASGWGKIHHIDLNLSEKKAIVGVENSPFALALRNQVQHEIDHFLRGMLAGVFSDYFEKEMDCVESKCTALNEKHCEFVIKQGMKFNFESLKTRRQLNPE